MMTFGKEEKQVSYLELIYDLIFVYMISRDNALLEHVENGFVEPGIFATFICCTLAIIQIWNATTFYINMFGRNGLRDHVFLLINMYLMYFLGEATQFNANAYVAQYHIAWGLILLNIGLQYFIELKNHKLDVWNQDIMKRTGASLFAEAALVFIAAFLKPYLSLTLSFIAVIVGIGLVAFGRKGIVGGQVDFTHLTERAMLYVVFTFGETVITIAGYFTAHGRFNGWAIYYSLTTFLIAVGLFISYEFIYTSLLDREKDDNGLMYMMLHIFIAFAINLVTVSFAFMREADIATYPKVMLLAGAMVTYFILLLFLGVYFKMPCRPAPRFVLQISVTAALFIFLMLLFKDHMAVNVLISAIYALGMMFIFYRIKVAQERKEKQIKK